MPFHFLGLLGLGGLFVADKAVTSARRDVALNSYTPDRYDPGLQNVFIDTKYKQMRPHIRKAYQDFFSDLERYNRELVDTILYTYGTQEPSPEMIIQRQMHFYNKYKDTYEKKTVKNTYFNWWVDNHDKVFVKTFPDCGTIEQLNKEISRMRAYDLRRLIQYKNVYILDYMEEIMTKQEKEQLLVKLNYNPPQKRYGTQTVGNPYDRYHFMHPVKTMSYLRNSKDPAHLPQIEEISHYILQACPAPYKVLADKIIFDYKGGKAAETIAVDYFKRIYRHNGIELTSREKLGLIGFEVKDSSSQVSSSKTSVYMSRGGLPASEYKKRYLHYDVWEQFRDSVQEQNNSDKTNSEKKF